VDSEIRAPKALAFSPNLQSEANESFPPTVTYRQQSKGLTQNLSFLPKWLILLTIKEMSDAFRLSLAFSMEFAISLLSPIIAINHPGVLRSIQQSGSVQRTNFS